MSFRVWGCPVGFVVEVPVEGGGRLLVEAAADQLPGELVLAARPGEVVTKAKESLEHALDEIQPAMRAVVERLTAMAPDEVSVTFGLKLGAETGIVVAKGTSEVHFTVSLTWRRDPRRDPRPDAPPDALPDAPPDTPHTG